MKRMTTAALLSAAALVSGQASADLAHQWTFDDGTANDSVGNADFSLRGDANVVNGRLVMTNANTDPNWRNDGAYLEGAALSAMQNTFAGITSGESLSIAIKYSVTQNQTWSKLFMAGSAGATPETENHDNYMDITPHRGNPNGNLGMSFKQMDYDDNGEKLVELGTNVPANTDLLVVGVWNSATQGSNTGSITLYSAIYGDETSIISGTSDIGWKFISNLPLDEFYLGSAVSWNDPDFAGTYDWVNVYNHALSEADVVAMVPEPASLSLLALGGLMVGRRRRAK